MTFDRRTEQLFARVTLVSGVGNPTRGRFCIMSFVALLADEGHGDAPGTASRVIRNFALPANDAMPHRVRQRLKPFAPRIVGTNDGLDAERAAVLYRATLEEILPRLQADAEAADSMTDETTFFERLWKLPASRRLQATTTHMLKAFEEEHGTAERGPYLGAAMLGRTIVLCARSAPSRERQNWYWDKAIELLDRLCDVGAPRRSAQAPVASRRAEALLGAHPAAMNSAAAWIEGSLSLRWMNPAATSAGDEA